MQAGWRTARAGPPGHGGPSSQDSKCPGGAVNAPGPAPRRVPLAQQNSSKRWPDADPADSSVPTVRDAWAASLSQRPEITELIEQGHRDGAVEVLQAVGAAMFEAVDLAKVHTSTGRCLTISSLVNAAAKTGDVDQLVESLRQVTHQWKGGVA